MICRSLAGKRVGFMKQNEFSTMKVGGSYADYVVTDYMSVIPMPEGANFD